LSNRLADVRAPLALALGLLLPGPVGSTFSMRKVVRDLQAREIEPLIVDPLGMGASTRPKGAD